MASTQVLRRMITWAVLVLLALIFVYLASYSISEEGDEVDESFVPFSDEDKEFENK